VEAEPVHQRNRHLAYALECEEAARRAGPEEERSLLFLAKRFRVLAAHADADPVEPAVAEIEDDDPLSARGEPAWGENRVN
jgi:hypothetical protein